MPGMPELPERWSWQPLDALCERVSVGHVGETSSFFCGPEGIRLLRSQNVRPGSLEIDNIRYVTRDFHEKSKKSQLKPGDILVVRVGQNRGDCCVVPNDIGDLNCANIVFARPEDTRYSDYLGYFLNSALGQSSLLSVSTGSAQEVLNTKSVAKVLVPVPPVEIAINLGSRLRCFDTKIELNRQTNQTLEQIAQALFKSWFVDFDPAIDNALAAGSPIPDELQERAQRRQQQLAKPDHKHLPDDIRQLFPSEFELTEELGWVPMGWEPKPFGDLLELTIGGDWGKDAPDEKHTMESVIVRGTDIPKLASGAQSSAPARWVDPKKLKTRSLSDSDIVIEVSGGSPTQPTGRSIMMTKNLLDRLGGTVEPASFCRKFRPVSREVGLVLGLHLQKIYADGKTWEYQNTSTGISNFQTKAFLANELVLTPSGNELLDEFFRTVRPIMDRITSNDSIHLEKLRDTLLPKLISGELRLPTDALADMEQQPTNAIV